MCSSDLSRGGDAVVGSTQYFSAYGAATGGYPLHRGDRPGPGESDPPEVLDLMKRVKIIPMVRRTLFGPRVTVFLKNGTSVTKEGTGREFIWDFETHAKRMSPVGDAVAIGPAGYQRLVELCRTLESADKAGPALIAATVG